MPVLPCLVPTAWAWLLKALDLGSTADWLLLHPPAPLLIARHGHTLGSVVGCVDGSPHADKVTRVLAELRWVDQVAVTILAIDDHRIDVDTAVDGAARRGAAVRGGCRNGRGP
jgi:hypothetical protein